MKIKNQKAKTKEKFDLDIITKYFTRLFSSTWLFKLSSHKLFFFYKKKFSNKFKKVILFLGLILILLLGFYRYSVYYSTFVSAPAVFELLPFKHLSGREVSKDNVFDLTKGNFLIIYINKWNLFSNIDSYSILGGAVIIHSNKQPYLLQLPKELLIDSRNKSTLSNFLLQSWTFQSQNKETILTNYLINISNVLGLQIDSVVFLKTDNYSSCDEAVCFKSRILEWIDMIYGPLELILHVLGLKNISFTDYISGTINNHSVARLLNQSVRNALIIDTKMIFDPTSEMTYRVNERMIKNLFFNINVSEGVRNEQAMVELYNGSSISGFATLNAYYLSNLGINIIRLGNYEATKQHLIYLKKQEDLDRFKFTINTIQRYFGHDIEIRIGDARLNTVGDIVIILGGNYER
jgi:hypothetical protein